MIEPSRMSCVIRNRAYQALQDAVHRTGRHYFLGRTGVAPYPRLRRQLLHKLIRAKALEAARLQGCFVVGLDATGQLTFSQKHCEHCLVYRHATRSAWLLRAFCAAA
jgi:hypothetical protein